MKEQKRYQIEKVDYNGTSKDNNALTCCYFPNSDRLLLTGYNCVVMARVKTPFIVGMWRIKQHNLKQSKNLNHETKR